MEYAELSKSVIKDNASFLDNCVARLGQSCDRFSFHGSVGTVDMQLCDYYAGRNYAANEISRQLYEECNRSAIKLKVPKENSLIDSMLRTTLGCEQKLAQSYLQIIDKTDQIQAESKQKRIDEARLKFAKANSYSDSYANSKSFMNPTRFAQERPVIDNEHEAYLKTHLTFLGQPKARGRSEVFDKNSETIARKISEIGGIEDTIGPMENSLNINQIRNVRNHAILLNRGEQKSRLSTPTKPKKAVYAMNSEVMSENWLAKSRQMRESLMQRLNYSRF